jgi:Tol biopolymer transport system component
VYRLRVATEPRLSPDGRYAVITLQTVAPTYDAYRQALWIVPTDPGADGEPRQLTLGARNDRYPRFSPDGRTLAFISDRRIQAEQEPARPKESKDREDKDWRRRTRQGWPQPVRAARSDAGLGDGQ